MKIHIEFCVKWDYGPEFDRVSKIINQVNSGIKIEGNKTSPRTGAFEVSLDDELLFSKFDKGRFPQKEEIIKWIE